MSYFVARLASGKCPKGSKSVKVGGRDRCKLRRVGDRTELGQSKKRIEYYGTAINPAHGKPELLLVVREGGRQVSQTWTGEVFKSIREAVEETGRRPPKIGP